VGLAHRLSRDVLSGSVVSVISVAYCVSFAALIFSADLAAGFSQGLNAILLGAGVSGIAVAMATSLPRAVAGPDTPVIAVFSALSLSIVAGQSDVSGDAVAYLTLAAIAVATVLTGIFLVLLGVFRLGSLFRFVPYSVVAGFLAASGCLLIAGAFRVAAGAPFTLDRLNAIYDGQAEGADRLLLAAGFVAAVFLARLRFRQFYVLPAMFCGLILLAHAYLRQSVGGSAQGWFLETTIAGGFVEPRLEMERLLQLIPIVADNFGEIAAVAIITAIAVVLNASGLEAVWKTNSDLDREFRVNGLANMLSGLLGGVAGNLSLNRSLLNGECGAVSRLSGAVPGVVCLALLAVGGDLLALTPTPALAGLLCFLGVSIIVTSLSWGSLARNWPEFLLTWAIAGLILMFGYLEGLFVGLVGAALLFAYNYSRVNIVKREYSRRDRSSTVDRAPEVERFLSAEGARIRGLDLHGYLFFATSSRLVEDLKRRIQDPDATPISHLIIDFGLVTGVDISTALSFAKLRNTCEEHQTTLLLAAMTPEIADVFENGPQAIFDGALARRFETRDEALEWAEEDLLRLHASEFEAAGDFEGWLCRQLASVDQGRAVLSFLERLSFRPGDRVVSQGDASDSVDLFVSGRVRVAFERAEETPLRLRTLLGHTVLGEMGFYRRTPRTATVFADEETVVYRMRRDAYDRMAAESPAAAASFDRFIIRILADRLTFANSEIAALML